MQIGLVPNTEFLKGTVELSRFGEILIDAKGHTNVEGVFAAGDCTTVPYKQIVIAAGEGTKAALSAFDHLIRTPMPRETVSACSATHSPGFARPAFAAIQRAQAWLVPAGVDQT